MKGLRKKRLNNGKDRVSNDPAFFWKRDLSDGSDWILIIQYFNRKSLDLENHKVIDLIGCQRGNEEVGKVA